MQETQKLHVAEIAETAQVEIGRRVELFTQQQAEILIRDAQEVGRMINGLVASLERSEHARPR